ncbi:YkvA family protein [Leptolyngbya sp. AN02str]|uniref:YkvA family protein n=1 Tax=Leptolyngbya sp. AN02str TaxID=3423363 RepID=UPI003D32391D
MATNALEGLYGWYRNTIRNPKYRWWIIAGTLAYILMPFDFLPDFIPVVGQLDDALVITLLFTELSQLLIQRVSEQRTKSGEQSVDAVEDSQPVDVKAVSID